MKSKCRFDGQVYDSEYGDSHPDAEAICGCWTMLHPDGEGGFVTDGEFQGPCKRDLRHTEEESVRVAIEDRPDTTLYRRAEGGWATESKHLDAAFFLSEEVRKIRTSLEEIIEEQGSQRKVIEHVARLVETEEEEAYAEAVEGLIEKARKEGTNEEILAGMRRDAGVGAPNPRPPIDKEKLRDILRGDI